MRRMIPDAMQSELMMHQINKGSEPQAKHAKSEETSYTARGVARGKQDQAAIILKLWHVESLQK